MPQEVDASHVERLITEGDVQSLRTHLVGYLKFSPSPRSEDLISLAMASNDQYFVSEVLKNLDYCGYRSCRFTELVRHALAWPFPDFMDIVRLAALNRIPNHLAQDPTMRGFLGSMLQAEDPIVRDAVVEVAQRLAGLADHEVVRGYGLGDLLERVDSRVRNWLDAR